MTEEPTTVVKEESNPEEKASDYEEDNEPDNTENKQEIKKETKEDSDEDQDDDGDGENEEELTNLTFKDMWEHSLSFRLILAGGGAIWLAILVGIVMSFSSLRYQTQRVSQQEIITAQCNNLSHVCEKFTKQQELTIQNLNRDIDNGVKTIDQLNSSISNIKKEIENITVKQQNTEALLNISKSTLFWWQVAAYSGVGLFLAEGGGFTYEYYAYKSCVNDIGICNSSLENANQNISRQNKTILTLSKTLSQIKGKLHDLNISYNNCMRDKQEAIQNYQNCNEGYEYCQKEFLKLNQHYARSINRLENSMETAINYNIFNKNRIEVKAVECFSSTRHQYDKDILRANCQHNGTYIEMKTTPITFGAYFKNKLPSDENFLNDSNAFVYINENGTIAPILPEKVDKAFAFPNVGMIQIGQSEIAVKNDGKCYVKPGDSFFIPKDSDDIYSLGPKLQLDSIFGYNITITKG